MMPLALTQAQLDQVMRTATSIPPDLRDEYLRRVWNVVRDADERPSVARINESSRLRTEVVGKRLCDLQTLSR
jgi:hypothetical protein